MALLYYYSKMPLKFVEWFISDIIIYMMLSTIQNQKNRKNKENGIKHMVKVDSSMLILKTLRKSLYNF